MMGINHEEGQLPRQARIHAHNMQGMCSPEGWVGEAHTHGCQAQLSSNTHLQYSWGGRPLYPSSP